MEIFCLWNASAHSRIWAYVEKWVNRRVCAWKIPEWTTTARKWHVSTWQCSDCHMLEKWAQTSFGAAGRRRACSQLRTWFVYLSAFLSRKMNKLQRLESATWRISWIHHSDAARKLFRWTRRLLSRQVIISMWISTLSDHLADQSPALGSVYA